MTIKRQQFMHDNIAAADVCLTRRAGVFISNEVYHVLYNEEPPTERIWHYSDGWHIMVERDIREHLADDPDLAIPLGLVPCPDCDGRAGEREKMTGPPGAGDIIIIACETCGGQNVRGYERRGCGWVNRECAAPDCTLTNGTPDDYCDVCQRAERGDT